MPEELKLADIAADKLTHAALRSIQRGMLVPDIAVSAFCQSMVTQAAIQAVINVLKSKNMIGIAELDRALANAYDDATAQADAYGRLAIAPGPSVSRGT